MRVARLGLIACIALASHAMGQVRATLPASGEFLVGQFMPVQIDVDAASRQATIELRAPGALPTTVHLNGESHATAPMLLLEPTARELTFSVDGSARQTVPSPLVALDNSADDPAPGAIGSIDSYAPTFSWQPGASARQRRVMILATVLLSIAITAAAALMKRRRAMIAIVLLIAISVFALEAWRRAVSPLWRAGGDIVIEVGSGGRLVVDSWQYLCATRPFGGAEVLIANARPVFADLEQAEHTEARLEFDARANTTTLHFVLGTNQKLAIVSRRETAGTARRSTQPPATSPMFELARDEYQSADTRIVARGEVEWIDDQTIHWPSIILARTVRSSTERE